MYNIDLTELGFYLRNTADELENESGTRYEIRRKYWSYALPKIKEVNAENGAFSNVDFSKENWINGYIGIAGFNICCVANYDSARVEMVFSKADKSVNKESFDKLKQYKAEVEKAKSEYGAEDLDLVPWFESQIETIEAEKEEEAAAE